MYQAAITLTILGAVLVGCAHAPTPVESFRLTNSLSKLEANYRYLMAGRIYPSDGAYYHVAPGQLFLSTEAHYFGTPVCIEVRDPRDSTYQWNYKFRIERNASNGIDLRDDGVRLTPVGTGGNVVSSCP
ncbi:hypothetical protein Deipe_2158 [Deinococcus peraridilitoris DSM 19664]|uniref:Lipoprotein n=1 Tax=Deinococcus peraridilitoris (strain DSM 19664 / LMG 22246 / CIP 109416 / KR-200) TaxID=937777 RepID=L0A3A6_DEIPD|nr:hypothetical protein Deipe_2158 [Deinococcus peraridilitoris DSM 19664]